MTPSEGAKPGIKAWLGRTPLGRIGEPDEVSGAVMFLCSYAGRFVTGTDVYVDGMWFFPFILPLGGTNDEIFCLDFRRRTHILVNRWCVQNSRQLLMLSLIWPYEFEELQLQSIFLRTYYVYNITKCPPSPV